MAALTVAGWVHSGGPAGVYARYVRPGYTASRIEKFVPLNPDNRDYAEMIRDVVNELTIAARTGEQARVALDALERTRTGRAPAAPPVVHELTVVGASDDIVVIGGAIAEEFYPRSEDDVIAVSDGTLLHVRYGQGGIWRIHPLTRGRADVHIDTYTPGSDENSDTATLRSTDPFLWVALGVKWAAPPRNPLSS